MKVHSVHVEERTVYICTCKAEFMSMREAEAHLRSPPPDKTKNSRPTKLKKRLPLSAEQEAVQTPEPTEPSTSLESPWSTTDQ